ncbi:bacillithiol biosynthesis cysteine-adding enzyme BshC [Rossellomorea marisflavi]|uniref:bacillithiol biosynthesis cysteine-adding enzyme BshC n=1 Tax=Rossellomorea marisflavi TaxID=189381 RepID=UPI0006F80E7D|nr:bacillithiol biosynthesis cysteine-adding enzyme BshC [Rossellomorea marisflavi]KQU60467.1 bacillithiol biosynthesis cysteine-adding enzyme BshC [Bacillus sp. Leaf406]MBV6683152.1 bacillithiol biosynthesis cysteine-adding enzyme BshC [Bacillus sp. JRC01]
MELESLDIPAINQFASKYMKQEEPVTSFFHYNINEQDVFSRRLEDLGEREFPREGLVTCIASYMESLPSSDAVEASLGKLKNDAVAVVAGQQAGLLTGPLYTIHKIVSVIRLAREQEQKLNHPVVPVFWIAGEDHDYQEVNHIFLEQDGKIKKNGYPEQVVDKRMTSDVEYDPAVMKNWISSILKVLGETEFTAGLADEMDGLIREGEDIVTFFARFIMTLFKDYGLLVIDSSYGALRKLEAPYFRHLIENSREITDQVLMQQKTIQAEGFNTQLEISSDAANIFLNLQNERALLERDGSGFKDKNNDSFFTKEELLGILDDQPGRLSNNVVTRPLMQEWLFPTLSFIGGPGEIAYWGELKKAFEFMGMNMPPVMPRLNITILERTVAKRIEELSLSLQEVVRNGVSHVRNEFLDSLKPNELEGELQEIETYLMAKYEGIKKEASAVDSNLEPIVDKNLEIHRKQFEFLRKRTEKSIRDKNERQLSRFDLIENSIRPNGGPQERTLNILYYMNRFGPDFVNRLTDLPFTFDGTHKVVHL